MKQSEIQALSAAPLTNLELAMLQETVFDQTLAQVTALAGALSPEQWQMCRYYLKVWYDRFVDGTVKVKGGKQGVDYDNLRDKLEMSQLIRSLLGLPFVSDERLAAIAASVRAQKGLAPEGSSAQASSSAPLIAVW